MSTLSPPAPTTRPTHADGPGPQVPRRPSSSHPVPAYRRRRRSQLRDEDLSLSTDRWCDPQQLLCIAGSRVTRAQLPT